LQKRAHKKTNESHPFPIDRCKIEAEGQMATTKVSVHEYLGTHYRPDVEYIDGELQERNV
jgi:hypothetical protein